MKHDPGPAVLPVTLRCFRICWQLQERCWRQVLCNAQISHFTLNVDIDCCLQVLTKAVPHLDALVSEELLRSWQAFTRLLIAESNLAARSALALGAARQLEKWGLEGLNYAASIFHRLK